MIEEFVEKMIKIPNQNVSIQSVRRLIRL